MKPEWKTDGPIYNSLARVHVDMDGTTQYFPSQPLETRMTIEELRSRMRLLAERAHRDPEQAHADADELLLEYVNDVGVAAAFNEIEKWYA